MGLRSISPKVRTQIRHNGAILFYRTVEETLDPNYYSNTYWKKGELYSADDILKEMEGL